jgi:hypothetical protein
MCLRRNQGNSGSYSETEYRTRGPDQLIFPANTVHTPAADVCCSSKGLPSYLLPIMKCVLGRVCGRYRSQRLTIRSKMQNSGLEPFRSYAFLSSWQKSHPRPQSSDGCVSLVCGGKRMGIFFAELRARISIQNFQFSLVPVSYTRVKSVYTRIYQNSSM